MRRPHLVAATIAALAAVTVACGSEAGSLSAALPTSPSSFSPPSAGPSVTLSGMVTDPAGTPINASVVATPLRSTGAWMGPPRSSQAAATGQYRFAALPVHPDIVYVRAWKEGYVQQCATEVRLEGDTTANLGLTRYANALSTPLPAVPNARQVSGVVYEMAAGGRRPVAGVWVGWEPVMDTVVADTRTDSEGRYRLCGLPMDGMSGLYAVRANSNRPVYTSAAAGGDISIDFELP
jgi:hypothetical protein